MNLKLVAVLAAASMMGLSGCANMTPSERQTAGTIGGAAGGALIGDAVIGGPLGTLGGAAAGGYLGNRATDPYRR
ncbi:osmotically inducible lipoprotein OsmB [Ramlibacter sp. AW1]|uniref:Osmotically inducible lipoprotein OsmB n=1 Tax=Ramlibacter aurantiacus TaxID=2801330 RepID=A0A937D713_9BURK|nr:glycine zipper 2TM domain-containing protein [Ramlibacter aurantiacus]MBL0420456.1 osmotically inducible lipoprotein OsmB [Ramlibacter aurantiacus]